MYRIEYKKSVLKAMVKMPIKVKNRVLQELAKIAEDPDRSDTDISKLVNRPGYRLRVGQWRVIYHRDDAILTIVVVKAGSRGDIYK